MKFFQNSVLQKHLKNQDADAMKTAYKKFTDYFHNPEIQQNIHDSKEEQFQEGFLRELFVNVLGYILNPNPNYNLTSELKNEKGAKKADGAILKDGKALGVIELKGTDTKDLDKINVQAFNYKNNQTGCIYVITSNFEKLRFFIHHSVDHLEFNLFTLSEDEFQLLWLCLSAGNLLTGVPLKVKEDSLLEEEKITKQLYKDYSAFRTDLWQNMVKNSPEADRLLLFKKTQKLLDRYLFILFAEDSGLLPPNSVSRIINRWELLKEEDAYKPLYIIFNQYFGYINTGRKGKNPEGDIFAYNGGLFLPDEVLDHVVIDDEILHPHVRKLTNYDFQTEIDVNILGHIFENSLNEIENITAEIEGQVLDKSKTKRKKDGVFYTPKYITKYIVENTIGKLCDEKKTELEIVDEEYAKGRRNRKKETVKKLADNLQAYRNWLLQITICDPACGSGAFLNQALEFLMTEHAYIDELQAQLFGASIVFQDISNHILEKNIFGVDINEESVDIAKLSLWLRTAQRGRKLTTLNNNIKCGNSLIDDPAVAGDKAFNWQAEFPAVFAKGGFDVVIGNPPYVRIQSLLKAEIDFYFETFSFPSGKLDISILFFEKALKLISSTGIASFISSSQWMQTDYGRNIRDKFSQGHLLKLVDFGSLPVFEDADTYPSIFIFTQQKVNELQYHLVPTIDNFNVFGIQKWNLINMSNLGKNSWNFNSLNIISSLKSKNKEFVLLKDIASCNIGDLTGMDKAFVISNKDVSINKLENEVIFGYAYRGEEVDSYIYVTPKSKIIYPYFQDHEGKTVLLDKENFSKNYPNVYNYLLTFKNELMERIDSRKKYAFEDNWFRHLRQGNINYYTPEKIIIKGIGTKLLAGILEQNMIFNGANCPAIQMNNNSISIKYLLSILNSRLITFHLNSICPKKLGNYYRYNASNISDLPIIKISPEKQLAFIEKADQMLTLNKELQESSQKFQHTIQRKFALDDLPGKLQNWYLLSYSEFIAELGKKKVKLSLSEEAEWEDYFVQESKKALELKAAIDSTDREIDRMVYALYGLNDEEIKIVEQA
jgi:hypothetical protein